MNTLKISKSIFIDQDGSKKRAKKGEYERIVTTDIMLLISLNNITFSIKARIVVSDTCTKMFLVLLDHISKISLFDDQ